jgi:hypothetical protein
MLLNIKEHQNAKQLHPSSVLEYPTIKDLIKEINDHLLQTIVFEEDFNIKHRLAIYDCIKEEEISKKAIRASEVLNFFINENFELINNGCYDFNLDQVETVYRLIILKNYTEFNDESIINVNIYYRAKNTVTEIKVEKMDY